MSMTDTPTHELLDEDLIKMSLEGLLADPPPGIVVIALTRFANIVESGDAGMTAVECEEIGVSYKALSLDDMRLIIRLRDLAESIKMEPKVSG